MKFKLEEDSSFVRVRTQGGDRTENAAAESLISLSFFCASSMKLKLEGDSSFVRVRTLGGDRTENASTVPALRQTYNVIVQSNPVMPFMLQ